MLSSQGDGRVSSAYVSRMDTGITSAAMQRLLGIGKVALHDLTERGIARRARDPARERIAKLQRGEDVQGGLKPMTGEDMQPIARSVGWTRRDIQHAIDLADLASLSEAAFAEFQEISAEENERAGKRIDRKLARLLLARERRRQA
jgi:hypothetical protein